MNRKVGDGSANGHPTSARVLVTVRSPEDVVEKIDENLDQRNIPLCPETIGWWPPLRNCERAVQGVR
jgi:hypothetical protein